MDVRQLARGPYWAHLGMHPEPDTDGVMVARMAVTEAHLQVMGRVHGGVLASLLDSAMALAVHADLPEGSAAATLDMHVSFVQPVREGILTGRARILSASRTVALVAADVRDAAGTLVATGQASYRLYPKESTGTTGATAATAAAPGSLGGTGRP